MYVCMYVCMYVYICKRTQSVLFSQWPCVAPYSLLLKLSKHLKVLKLSNRPKAGKTLKNLKLYMGPEAFDIFNIFTSFGPL